MAQPVRSTTKLLFVVAMLNAGCAQLPGIYSAGNGTSASIAFPTIDWPTPTLDNSFAPDPSEPTLLPQAMMPAEQHVIAEPARRAVPRRTPAALRAATAPVATTASAPLDIWQRVRNGFRMGPTDSSLVKDWEVYYASRPDYFARMIDNCGHFLYHIANEVERRGMPLEIALLPMIESAYNPVAYSSAHASGIWQFISSTGKNYGLKQNWWYDGRRDVIAATSAALDYLQTLYGMFNDWELALAAYNWGEGAVQRAVERNQAKGLPTDYLSLASTMPAETRNYLPKLMAVKNIIIDPARYGLPLAHVPNEPFFETVAVQRHIDVTLAARFADMSLDAFKFLNPAHNKPVINSDSAETIVLPKHKVTEFLANMSAHEDKPLVSMKTHRVSAGERPEAIADRYNISVAELNKLNGIGGRRRIVTGQTLMVPNHDDLQPVLADIPMATTLIAAATRPVYNRKIVRKVVVTRGGVRRTVVVATPAQRRNARMPVHAVGTAKPAARKIAHQSKSVVNDRNR